MATTPTLSAPVGPGQPNRPDDLKLLRQALNDFSSRGFLQPPITLPAEGGWDAALAAALQAVENQYFYGEADPDNKLETNDTLFQFLVQSGQDSQRVAASLSGETYGLAAAMVPGGVDRTKRSTVQTPQLVNGKTVMKREVRVERVSGNIRSYLPFILQALTQRPGLGLGAILLECRHGYLPYVFGAPIKAREPRESARFDVRFADRVASGHRCGVQRPFNGSFSARAAGSVPRCRRSRLQ